jgi:hypothetical protein
MKIVNNWRSRLSDYSTISLAFSTAVAMSWSALPADWLAHLPVEWVARSIGAITALGLLGKFVSQEKQNDAR